MVKTPSFAIQISLLKDIVAYIVKITTSNDIFYMTYLERLLVKRNALTSTLKEITLYTYIHLTQALHHWAIFPVLHVWNI